MTRTLKSERTNQQERFSVPRSVQQIMPVDRVYHDGIFEVGKRGERLKRFSATFEFSDINYLIASHPEKVRIYECYGRWLNSLDTAATYQITCFNRYIDPVQFEAQALMRRLGDALDMERESYNRVISGGMDNGRAIEQHKYVTVSTLCTDVAAARDFFHRTGVEFAAQFSDVHSRISRLDLQERLRILHDFFRSGEEMYYDFDLVRAARRGHHFKDYVAPDGIEQKSDYLRIGDKFARPLVLLDYPSTMKDDLVSRLTETRKPLMLSVCIKPVPQDEALRDVERQLLGISTEAVKYNKKQVQDGTLAELPYDKKLRQDSLKDWARMLTTQDQHMLYVMVSLIHLADTKEELDADTGTLLSIAQSNSCKFGKPRFLQLPALNTVLPYGVNKLLDNEKALRTMTTANAAGLILFRCSELLQYGGVYRGRNPISLNPIIADRKQLMNGNGCIFGTSGGGKSVAAKWEIFALILGTEDTVYVIDPEREYGKLVQSLGGEVICISASADTHINAFAVNMDYGDSNNPLYEKTNFILSLCEAIMGTVTPVQKSLISAGVQATLLRYIQTGYQGKAPTLVDFYDSLKRQLEQCRREKNTTIDGELTALVYGLEPYITGSFNLFAHDSNVDLNKRIVCFDIKDLAGQMKTVGMLVILDCIINRVGQNRAAHRYTHIFADEFHLFTKNAYSRGWFFDFWKRARKYGACCTGITQNVGDLLNDESMKAILANSEFLLLLNQAPMDAAMFRELFSLSDAQMTYITNTGVGMGLLKHGSAIQPWVNLIPKDNPLYPLLTTRIDEAT